MITQYLLHLILALQDIGIGVFDVDFERVDDALDLGLGVDDAVHGRGDLALDDPVRNEVVKKYVEEGIEAIEIEAEVKILLPVDVG